MTFVRYDRHPAVSHPVMVCAFRGWNDAGEAASTAASYLRERWHARRFASLDPEEFFDFQVSRPTVRLVDGTTRQLDWPANDFLLATPGGKDVVLFIGIEPNVRWRTFTEALLSVARELEVELLVTLGAFLADVPHTFPAPVNGSSADPGLMARLGVEPSRYEGPTGIVGVLHDAAHRAGVPSVSVWAAAPHYLPGGTNPRVAMALLEKVRELLGVEMDTDALAEVVEGWDQQVRQAVEEDPNLVAYVRRLEEAAAEQEEFRLDASGEALAAELERFLRNHRGDGNG